jgi:hypothetical protein
MHGWYCLPRVFFFPRFPVSCVPLRRVSGSWASPLPGAWRLQALDLVEGFKEPLAEIDAVRHEIKADCVNRVHLSAEIEHYSEKVTARCAVMRRPCAFVARVSVQAGAHFPFILLHHLPYASLSCGWFSWQSCARRQARRRKSNWTRCVVPAAGYRTLPTLVSSISRPCGYGTEHDKTELRDGGAHGVTEEPDRAPRVAGCANLHHPREASNAGLCCCGCD